jgi:chromate transporter
MILASGYILIQALDDGWLAQVLAIASTVTLMLRSVPPLVLIFTGAAVFVALHAVAMV